jgi:NAD(P)-dependent dehydrogenase (short-subunit alcohol dehydrogenase family)
MDTFSGKVAVVTGAGRGIGFVIASYLIAEGATVYVPDLDGERSTQAAKPICWSTARAAMRRWSRL